MRYFGSNQRWLGLFLVAGLALALSACSSKNFEGQEPLGVPDWYSEVDDPVHAAGYVYASGVGLSPDYNLSLSRAKAAASVKLAQRMEVQVDSLFKTLAEEFGSERVEHAHSITKSVIAVTLRGAVIDKSKVYQEDGLYRVYVRLKVHFSNLFDEALLELSDDPSFESFKAPW